MILWWLAACAGGGDDTPADSGPTTTDTGTEVLTYEADWEGVDAFLADHCDECHPATNGIDLRENLDVYVVPGSPDDSDLWYAVQGLSISTMMPPSGRLPDETIAHIEAWIQAGAVRP